MTMAGLRGNDGIDAGVVIPAAFAPAKAGGIQ